MEIEAKKIINCGEELNVHIELDEYGKPNGILKISKSVISPCPAELENTIFHTKGIPECSLLGCPFNLDGESDLEKIIKIVDFPDPDSFPRS